MAFELCANLSILMPDLPLQDQFEAAAHLGFRSVELWWPFDDAVPDPADVEALIGAIDASGLRLAGLNLFAGDMPAGERGIASHPGREGEFRANVAVVVEIARRTGCRVFNALYGARVDGADGAEQDRVAIENLAFAAEALGEVGGTLLIEPLSGTAGFPVLTAAEGMRVVDEVARAARSGRVGLLFDTFHLTNNGDDLVEVIATCGERIAHVQFADSPGRGEPGTGDVDFERVLDGLVRAGYDGLVSCEYAPTVPVSESLRWIEDHPRVSLPI
ncbi:TIM barrel protein [Microbacterium sp. Bi121]|uniref:hydroxypyruvate isomerase family protein n=1 Tax=Microbacterium sp. Bi121 TaxID=2822348 RepID=UPI001D78655C|nr:TIM barrel protein [Microbacterium sp. Bi121]CAH0123222.1 Hydroxypyruvate isomerase [Microbacterium sp. Bi121]